MIGASQYGHANAHWPDNNIEFAIIHFLAHLARSLVATLNEIIATSEASGVDWDHLS